MGEWRIRFKMNEEDLKEQFEEYKKWRSGFEFSGNENLLMYLFCLKKMEMRRAFNFSCYKWNVKIVDEKIKEVLSNSSPPVRTSDKSDSAKAEGFNMGLEVPTSSTPKSPSATSPNPNIKRNFGFCSKALRN